MITKDEKIEKLKMLRDFFFAKEDLYDKKWKRARVSKSIDFHFEKWKLYTKLIKRCSDLAYRIRKGKRAFEKDTCTDEFEYNVKQRIKAKNREEFETLHRYGPWFMQCSLRSDYGTFTCDKCGSTFYHSPSTITKGVKTIYECCCGHCTNSIIQRDHDQTPFH